MQAVVMSMADNYIAALGESIYLVLGDGRTNSRARWLAQSFLRNGVGASIDIASGSNPEVSLLDLLVLSSLKTWAFETHWVPAGIDSEHATKVAERLQAAETAMWAAASKVFSVEQSKGLKALIRDWIASNPDQTVVSFVRFAEFSEGRRLSSADASKRARGLLSELSNAAIEVDKARLLGERLIWFAGRYPYVLGEQSELTAYRLADQPEVKTLVDAAESIHSMSDSVTKRIEHLDEDLIAQQELLFEKIRSEREAALQQFFAFVKKDLSALVDEISNRKGEAIEVAEEIQMTLQISKDLSVEIARTVDTVDRIVARFTDEAGDRGEFEYEQFMGVATETKLAAHELRLLLKEFSDGLLSDGTSTQIERVESLSDRFLFKAFLYALCLLLVFFLGLYYLMRQRRNKGSA
jgi:hypothetical protein